MSQRGRPKSRAAEYHAITFRVPQPMFDLIKQRAEQALRPINSEIILLLRAALATPRIDRSGLPSNKAGVQPFTFRLPVDIYTAMKDGAERDLRSLNSQVMLLLHHALNPADIPDSTPSTPDERAQA